MSWFTKLRSAFSKTSSKIGGSISKIFSSKKVDAESLAELKENLIKSDVGPVYADKISNQIKKLKIKDSIEEFKEQIAELISDQIKHAAQDVVIVDDKPNVILLCGINGSGKTTTLGKIAAMLKNNSNHDTGTFNSVQNGKQRKVIIGACDTFRAAAVAQVQSWAKQDFEFIKGDSDKSEPASVAYTAVNSANAGDVVLIDTAGRLHNNTNLMNQLVKIDKVVSKFDINKQVLLVLDGSNGQNTIKQLSAFKDFINIDGIVVTKLDGTAKGGFIIPLINEFNIPIYFICIGEKSEDIRNFDSLDFARALVQSS
jgi:fused signal recognition particle receptor